MDDSSMVLVVVVLLLLLPLMYYMYNNKKISLSCPKPLTPPECPLSFKDYYALSPIKYWGYNLSFTVYYPYAANYCFDDSDYRMNSWASPDPNAPISKAVAKKIVNGVPSTNQTENDLETRDLLETLKLFSHKTKVGDWNIYNVKTKECWSWNPTANRVNGYWTRTTDPTNPVFTGPNKKQLLDYLAFLYLVLDKGGMGSTPFPYSGEFKYWGKV